MALMYYFKTKLLLLQEFKLLVGRIILKVLGKHGSVKIGSDRILLCFFPQKTVHCHSIRCPWTVLARQ